MSRTQPARGLSSGASQFDDAEIATYVQRATRRGLETLPSLSAFSKQMERFPQLSPHDQGLLVAQYQQTQAAGGPRNTALAKELLEQIVGSNFRLVLLISREQATKRYPSRDGLAELLPDLVSEGNAALVEAARTFDDRRSPNFPTYAARAVRDRVRFVLSQHTPIRMPASKVRIQRIARYVITELTDKLGRPPTGEEIQTALHVKCMEWAAKRLTAEQLRLAPEERHKIMVAKLKKQGMIGAVREIEEILTISQPMASLDASLGDDGSASLGDIVGSQDSGYRGVELDELRENLLRALGELPERERQIILYRHGFVDGESWTFSRIAEKFGVTAERIRQIEKTVLTKLAEGDTISAWRN